MAEVQKMQEQFSAHSHLLHHFSKLLILKQFCGNNFSLVFPNSPTFWFNSVSWFKPSKADFKKIESYIMDFDQDEFIPSTEGLDLTRKEKLKLIQIVWRIVEAVIDDACGIHL